MKLSEQFLGPAVTLLPWMEDERVTDLLINGSESFYIEADGRLEPHASPFFDRTSLMNFIERLLIPLGKRIDAATPFTDGTLADGSRFHIILPPLASEGPCISIRKLRRVGDLSLRDFAPPELVAWLRRQLESRKNILIAGGTGVGKTTLLSLLLNEISAGERVTVLEECHEIVTFHPHVIYLESRVATPDGLGAVSLRTLLRNALRMRPDRIILGECRGEEAFDMLQAMSTGHAGSLGTIHANHAVDALRRLETLAVLSNAGLSARSLRDWVAAAVHAVIYLERAGERRYIREAIEVNGLEGDVYRINPYYHV